MKKTKVVAKAAKSKVSSITKAKPKKAPPSAALAKPKKEVTSTVVNTEEQFQAFSKAYTRSERIRLISVMLLTVVLGTLAFAFFSGVISLASSLNQLLLNSLLGG